MRSLSPGPPPWRLGCARFATRHGLACKVGNGLACKVGCPQYVCVGNACVCIRVCARVCVRACALSPQPRQAKPGVHALPLPGAAPMAARLSPQPPQSRPATCTGQYPIAVYARAEPATSTVYVCWSSTIATPLYARRAARNQCSARVLVSTPRLCVRVLSPHPPPSIPATVFYGQYPTGVCAC
jgi:hypothetical protein